MKNLADFLYIEETNFQTLEKNIRKNKLVDVAGFLESNPGAVRAKITNMGRTALHVAIVAGCDAIVKELLNRTTTTQEDLKIEDNAGLTVLDCCAVFGNKQMAEIIVTKFPDLLRIGNGPKKILPVVLAIWRNSSAKDMVSYLYEKTPKEYLNGVNGATFINKCLYAKAFGENLRIEHTFVCYFYVRNLTIIPFQLITSVCHSIDLALDLLKREPELITCLDLDGVSPPVVLATLSYAFRSGNQLGFWKRWIYDGGNYVFS